MNFLLAVVAATASLGVEVPMTPISQTTELAVMCFKSGEQTSGMNKICYYDCMGSTKAITVGVAQLCPLSVND